MKRSKQTIINRRIMHRYQQKYRLWQRYLPFPILRNTSIVDNWDSTKWLEYARQGVIILTKGGDL